MGHDDGIHQYALVLRAVCIGDHVLLPYHQPRRLISKSKRDYWPMESKRLGEEGNVVVGIKISETGCVIGKELIIYSGSDMLDRAALEFIETVEYLPAAKDGKPIESVLPLRIIFKYRN